MALLWRTRRYLADASAVELTRNPDALATALHCLSEDTTAVGGGGWATHLFVVDPKGDSGLRGMPPSDDQKRKAISAWLATEPGSAPATTNQSAAVDTADFLRMRTEMISTAKAAMTGDGRAVERMAAFAQLMGSDPALGLGAMPSLADLAAARRGDAAALQRIQALRQTRTDRLADGEHHFLSSAIEAARQASAKDGRTDDDARRIRSGNQNCFRGVMAHHRPAVDGSRCDDAHGNRHDDHAEPGNALSLAGDHSWNLYTAGASLVRVAKRSVRGHNLHRDCHRHHRGTSDVVRDRDL